MASSEAAKYLFIGGGLANGTAAQAVREKDPEGRILLVTAEDHAPYHRPPLSKDYLRGEGEWQDPDLLPAEEWAAKKIEIRTGTWVTSLDTASRTATLDSGDTITYEKVCLATGATPRALSPDQTPGADAEGVYVLRTRADADAIKKHLTPGARAVLIGAGYIGMEVGAVCRQKGVEVTILDTAPQPWGRFASPAFGAFLKDYYEQRGVTFRLNDGVREIMKNAAGKATAVKTRSGQTLPADFLVVGIGVTLNTQLAKAAGLAVDDKDGVEVNEYLETSVPGVYAAGDIARFKDPVLGKNWHIEHWQNAEWHGQIVGANLAGERVAYDKVPWFFSDEFDGHMLLRGDPQSAKESFVIGAMNQPRFLELYLRDDGTLAMGLLFSPEFDESATADLLEKLIRARVNLAPHRDALAAGTADLARLLPE